MYIHRHDSQAVRVMCVCVSVSLSECSSHSFHDFMHAWCGSELNNSGFSGGVVAATQVILQRFKHIVQ